MPRGGRRVGAGRKPKPSNVVGMDGKPRADVIPASMQPVQQTSGSGAGVHYGVAAPPLPLSEHLAEPPGDLCDAHKTLWRQWAPKAIAQGTLTDLTTPGFRELVKRAAIVDRLNAVIEAGAPGWDVALKSNQKQYTHFDRLLMQFKLTGAGKPEPTKKKAGGDAPGNPWAGFGAPIAK
jgi:hypothetical protein